MVSLGKRWAIVLAVTLVLLAGAYFARARTIDHFLNEGGLVRAIGRKTAVIMKADAGYLPLFWRGLSARTDGLLVRGKSPRSLKDLRVSNVRAYCSLHDLWQRKFTINRLQADRLEVAFGTAAARQLANILPSEPELQPQVDVQSPLKLAIRETVVGHTDIFWGETPSAVGALRDVESKYYPNGRDLDAVGTGGTLQQTGWPPLRIVRIQTHYAKPKLEIQSAAFAIGKTEDVALEGEFDFGENGGMHLHTRSTHAPATPFPNSYWRGKFEAEFDGETEIEKKVYAKRSGQCRWRTQLCAGRSA